MYNLTPFAPDKTHPTPSCPESKLWAAFLLSILRDVIPEYITSYGDPKGRVSAMNASHFETLTNTYIFELACHANNLSPSRVRRILDTIRTLSPTPEQISAHCKKFPNGGRSPLYTATLGETSK